MKKNIYKVAVLGIVVLGCLVTRQHAFNGTPPPTIQLSVKVPATQPYTLRDNSWPPDTFHNLSQGDLRFENARPTPAIIMDGSVKKMNGSAEDFKTGNALVLLKCNLVRMDIEGSSSNGTTVKFKVFRDYADSATVVGTGTFTITAASGTTPAKMTADKRGSFFLVGYVDDNGDGDYQTGEPSIAIPVIIVDVDVLSETSSADPAGVHYERLTDASGAWNISGIKCGNWSDDTPPDHHAITFRARCKLTGGGAAGKLGTDRVYASWSQQIQGSPVSYGVYTDGATTPRERTAWWLFASNVPPSKVLTTTPPDLLTTPMLDAIEDPAGLMGGNRISAPWPYEKFTLGPNTTTCKLIDVTGEDSPEMKYYRAHPGDQTLLLGKIAVDIQFRTYLTFWTTSSANAPITRGDGTTDIPTDPTDPNLPGERTYYDAYRYEWRCGGTVTVNTSNGNQVGNITKISEIQTRQDYSPISPADALSRHHETRPPTGLAHLVLDATEP